MKAGNPFVERFVMEPKIQNFWGLAHALEFFTMGTGAALFILAAAIRMELGALAGVVLVLLGGVSLLQDLGKPDRFWRTTANLKTSWVARGALGVNFFMITSLLFVAPFVLELVPIGITLPWTTGSTVGMIFLALASASAIVVAIYHGLVLGSSSVIPAWRTALVPTQFFVNAFASGAAFLWILDSVTGSATMDPRMSVQVIALLTIASLLILLGYTLGLSNGTAAAKTSFGILTNGKTGAYFIGGGIFVGLLLPTILLAIALIVGPSPVSNTLTLISSITILVGNFFSKVSVLKAGVYEPTF